MKPAKWLRITGIFLLVLAILGIVGVFGPTSFQSIFTSSYWLDNSEIWLYLLIGIACLFVSVTKNSRQKIFCLFIALSFLLFFMVGVFSVTLWGMHFEIADNWINGILTLGFILIGRLA